MRQIRADHTAGDVVGRSNFSQLTFSPMPDETMAVGGSRVEIKLSAAERLLYGADQLIRFLRGDIAGTIVQKRFFFVRLILGQGYQVAAQCHILVRQLNADVGCLQRRAAGIALSGVITHHRQIGHIAARGHPLLYGTDQADFRVGYEGIHGGLMSLFHGCHSSQGRTGGIRHSVAKQNHIFH